MRTSRWWEPALQALLAGASIAEAARACGIRRETLSKALNAPDSPLKAELERRRAAAAAPTSDQVLADRARAVIAGHLDDGQDPKLQLDAAKVALTDAARQASIQPEEPPAEEEVTAATALRELVAALPTIRILLREHEIPTDLRDELRHALDAARRDLDLPSEAPPVPPAPSAPPASAGPLLN